MILSKIKATENISKLNSLFKVSDVVKREILHEIVNLDASKFFQDTDVPTKIIKENDEVFAIMFKQLGDSMEDCFLKFQYGFTKACSTQQCLIALIEKWKSATDKGNSFRELLRDLSKAFDCLPHELLIANLHAYGFSLDTLRLVCSYSCLIKNKDQKKKRKRNESYSSWEEILFEVPQGPLWFNIFICDLFIMIHDININNYAADNTPFVSGGTAVNVLTSLKNADENVFE